MAAKILDGNGFKRGIWTKNQAILGKLADFWTYLDCICKLLVPETGIEPVRPFSGKRRILSPLCLPISPLRHLPHRRADGHWIL